MKIVYGAAILVSVTLCVWLFLNERAAEPGSLSIFHQENDRCDFCHLPWRGVSDRVCLECHDFNDVSLLSPEIRFHEAEKHCLKCHVEHQGSSGNISRVDHTLFNGEFQCTRCHTDIHGGLFGSKCRECHGIKTWDVPGFRHPPEDRLNCDLCHKAPYSHQDNAFWQKIEMTHGETLEDISREDCWRCHTTRNWQHLIMPHSIEDIQGLDVVE
ncbi:MAG: hypothetical protein K9N21_18605 [Deltaproteobacteria bacterium]|nr:hypothetical protein [Deltaproteobacteria bacterium]